MAWTPVFENPSVERQLRFVREPGVAVDLHVVFYADQRKGSELIAFGNDWHGEAWRRMTDTRSTVAIDGRPLNVNLRHMSKGATRRFVWGWYWVDGRYVTGPIQAKLAQVSGKLLTGRRAAAAVMISLEAPDETAALAVARDFLAAMPPIMPQLEAVAASLR
jgi:EpsI family protein